MDDGLAWRATAIEQLRAVGLADQATQIVSRCLPAVRLTATETDESRIPPGASKLGGRPDLPADVEWPYQDEVTPLAFVAQINLDEIHQFDVDTLLPADGLLSFFYESEEQSQLGLAPEEELAWAVLYTPAGADLRPRELPDDLGSFSTFGSRHLTASVDMMFPSWLSCDLDDIPFTDEQEAAYRAVADRTEPPGHRLLGHPDVFYYDVQAACQLVTNGLRCYDYEGFQHPMAEELMADAGDWRLLLQIGEQADIDMAWRDRGHLCFCIRRQDLAAGRWNKVWLVSPTH